MNALDESGQPIYDDEKKTLLDRVEFYESDLLGYCRDNHIELERIVGCIPQVSFLVVWFQTLSCLLVDVYLVLSVNDSFTW